jgi:putative transcriptional regulator
MTEDELKARDAKRDIGAEILQALKELRTESFARKTTFESLPEQDGVLRRIVGSDGTVEKEEILTGPRWSTMAARAKSGLSQSAFARALGVSKRTLENWEQGRATPSGAARRLLALAARYPDTVERLAALKEG